MGQLVRCERQNDDIVNCSGHAKMAQLHCEPFAGDGNGIVRRISNDGQDREVDGANDASSAALTLPLWQNNKIEAACERQTLWALQQ